jgi:signal recognition particle GTPase
MDWDELEFALIGADTGARIAAEVVADAKKERERGTSFRDALQQALLDQLEPDRTRQTLRRVGFQLDVTRHNLMEELKKVRRVIDRADPGEPAEVWLVLDAVTGQNGLEQARRFNEAIGLTGVVLTKLDGTAKGGILLPITRELKLPIKFIGVGEQAEDLQPYAAAPFVEALLDMPAAAE